jgi:hypothetical protein
MGSTNLFPQVLREAQWDYITALLRSEAGLGTAPSGTTSGNRLTALKYVGQSLHLWTEKVPALGIQLRTSNESQLAVGRHGLRSTFDIVIGTQSTPASAASRFGAGTKINLEDAMLQLKPIVNDYAGGTGLEFVLKDPQYRLLGTTSGAVNANRSQIESVTYSDYIKEGANGQVWAYAHIVFIAEQLVGIA